MKLRYKFNNIPPRKRFTLDMWLKINFYWLLAALIVPNIALGVTEHLGFGAFITNILLPLGLYWLGETFFHRPWKATLFLFPWMFFAAFQVVLLYLYGRSIIAVDMFLNVATTNMSEASELLLNLVPALLSVFVLYIPPIVTATVAQVRKARMKDKFLFSNRIIGCAITFAGMVSLVATYIFVPGYAACDDLFPLNVCYNLKVAVERGYHAKRYKAIPPNYHFATVATHNDSIPELYVVVIGETSRADNWQIFGYPRPTTPDLDNLPGLIGYPRAMSESNTTHKSVPMLLSHVDSHTFADSLRHIKSLITAFKEAGFATAAISNQQRNGSYIDCFLEEADTCIFIKDLNSDAMDLDMVDYVNDIINRHNRKQLIVLHSYGSHFKYSDRYPAAFAHFTPDHPLEATPKLRPRLINAYDNTILYTSHLLGKIAGMLGNFNGPAAMVYTSDHGEDIFDDSRNLFLHASPVPSYMQLHVPFIIWMSSDYVDLYPRKFDIAKAHADSPVSSSASLFPTVMDIAGLRSHAADTTRALTSGAYHPVKPSYLTDRDESVDLEIFGITPP